MKAAIVLEAGKTPVPGDFLEPAPREGESRITVAASALGHLTKGRAAGALENAFKGQFARGGDVVWDCLWGVGAERLLIAGAKEGEDSVPIRFIQIVAARGENISLPGAALGSSAIERMGSGLGGVPFERLVGSIDEGFQA